MKSIDMSKLAVPAAEKAAGIPPVDKWDPAFCGDLDMRIARDGTWFHEGRPIERPAMVKMFSRILWQEEGAYFLKTPVEKVGIQVEDLPFLFVELDVIDGEQGPQLQFRSTTDDLIIAGPEQALVVNENASSGEPEPALEVRFGMWGRIHRNVFYQLVEMGQLEPCAAGGEEMVVYSRGKRFVLGRL